MIHRYVFVHIMAPLTVGEVVEVVFVVDNECEGFEVAVGDQVATLISALRIYFEKGNQAGSGEDYYVASWAQKLTLTTKKVTRLF